MVHIVKDSYFILLALHKYIGGVQTFLSSKQVPAPFSLEKRGSSVFDHVKINIVSNVTETSYSNSLCL